MFVGLQAHQLLRLFTPELVSVKSVTSQGIDFQFPEDKHVLL
jgi:hypothetical protein